jgi:hypothetical protein
MAIARVGLYLIAGLAAAACTSSNAHAQSSADERILIQALDKAFRPGFLETRGLRKATDGTYFRLVTTGDAILKPSFGVPLQTLRTACISSGNTLELRISAGKAIGDLAHTSLDIGTEHLTVDRDEMWTWFSIGSRYAHETARNGFAPLFATSYFAERATRSAEADPPFGLFACKTGNGRTVWAAAILPVSGPSDYDLGIKVTPVTAAWIRGHYERAAEADRAARERERQRLAGIAHAQAEQVRLRPFRTGLNIGSRTNCGIVIAVRNPLVQVQLPPHIPGPSGIREFWVRRDILTDAQAPDGCNFGG